MQMLWKTVRGMLLPTSPRQPTFQELEPVIGQLHAVGQVEVNEPPVVREVRQAHVRDL